jgi:hypothetical protein
MRIVAGPFVILPMIQDPRGRWTQLCNWMPVIGTNRKVLMTDVVIQFEPAFKVPVQADSEDERPRDSSRFV